MAALLTEPSDARRSRRTPVLLLVSVLLAAVALLAPPAGAVTAPPSNGTPSAPTGVAVTAGHGFARVTWSPPGSDGGHPIGAYFVAAAQGTQLAALQLVAPDVRNVSLPGLGDGASYDVYVAAYNDHGIGALAGPLKVVPRAAAPAAAVPAAPTAPTIAVGSGFASVHWAPPTTDNGSPISAYSAVAVDVATGKVAAWRNLFPDTRGASLPGLVNGKAYDVSVFAWNGVGGGTPTAALRVTPSAGGPAAQPPTVPAWAGATPGKGQVGVHWLPPADEGGAAVTGYTVMLYDTATAAVIESRSLAAGARSSTFTGLTAGKSYNVSVAAVNSKGTGPIAPATHVVPK